MSLQEELAAVRRRLDDLIDTVDRLERRIGQRSGDHASAAPGTRADEFVTIPETPYNSALWTDSDDEGLGVRHHRAP